MANKIGNPHTDSHKKKIFPKYPPVDTSSGLHTQDLHHKSEGQRHHRPPPTQKHPLL